MKNLLFITNGHGEDIVAAKIIREIKGRNIKIDVMPVVGHGDAFKGLKVSFIGPKKILPSGGFGLRNYSFLIRDIFAGLLTKAYQQMKLLRKKRGRYDLVIGIGDIVPIFYSVITASPFVFVGVNKSEYYSKLAFNYTSFEKWLLKKHCKLTLARDKRTADALSLEGINTKYVGNPMMDMGKSEVRSRKSEVMKDTKRKTIGFLPGTRDDAYKNIEDFAKIAWQINKLDKNIRFVLSCPASLDAKKVEQHNKFSDMAVIADFSAVLSASDIIIGLSGTGNEQAAGLGKPVIAFPGRGAQFNSKFAIAQKQLLGDALMLTQRSSEMIAHEAVSLIYDKKRISLMSKAGKVRMGRPGASKKIAEIIVRMLKK
jgi:hypothetical protein